MIGRLYGEIIHKDLDRIELDTNGIGWEVFIAKSDLDKIVLGKKEELFIFHHVAENENCLFGFLDRGNKKVFEMLISVSGIGPKTAMEIFTAGPAEKILKAISSANVEFFQQVKGIGKKGAQRIIIDLKSKVGSIKDLDLQAEDLEGDVVFEALQNLGFSPSEIRKALANLPDSVTSDDEKIKFVLKTIGANNG